LMVIYLKVEKVQLLILFNTLQDLSDDCSCQIFFTVEQKVNL
jgi:hypothetical protein